MSNFKIVLLYTCRGVKTHLHRNIRNYSYLTACDQPEFNIIFRNACYIIFNSSSSFFFKINIGTLPYIKNRDAFSFFCFNVNVINISEKNDAKAQLAFTIKY